MQVQESVDNLLSKVIIRPAREEDLLAMEWDGEFTHFRRLYAEAYRRAQMGEAAMWVADLPGVGVIGQLFVHLKSDRKELADGLTRAYIYGFRVQPAYRDRGLGTQLMASAEADLIRRGFRWVVLNVGRDNPSARRLYERNGYRVISGDPGRWSYIDDKGIRRQVHEPAWRMEKRLGSLI